MILKINSTRGHTGSLLVIDYNSMIFMYKVSNNLLPDTLL